MLEAISCILALLNGFLAVRAFDPVANLRPRWAAMMFRLALGSGVGIGLASIVFLFLDVAGVAAPAAIFVTDVVLAGILSWFWIRTRNRGQAFTDAGEPLPGFRWNWALMLALAIIFLIVSFRLVQMAGAVPTGQWDAWAIWNLRAKYLAGPGNSWHYAVSGLLSNTHPDYPLLLSSFIARLWKAAGSMDFAAPIITGLIFFAGLLALLISAVALLRSVTSGLLAALVLLSTTSLLIWAPAQYADIPISFYYLGAIAALFIAMAPGSGGQRALFWAGVCAGLAAWTKNEGIAFLLCLLAVFFVLTLRQQGPKAAALGAGTLLGGAAPGILLTLWLKFFLAPASDPLVTQGLSGLERLRDFSRYTEIASGFFTDMIQLGSGVAHPLVLMAILAIVLRWQIGTLYKTPVVIAAATLTLVFLSYCAVYLITPSGVAWHVQTSFNRLILQIWPSALLVFFLVLRSVADGNAIPAEVKGSAARRPAGRRKKGSK
jgi:hypothetical protein